MTGLRVAQAGGGVLRPMPRPGGAAQVPAPAATVSEGVPVETVVPAARPGAAAVPQDIRTRPTPGERVRDVAPRSRPAGFADRVTALLQKEREAQLARQNATSVANRQISAASTLPGEIDMTQISLIGIFGTSQARRALVRLSTGEFVRVAQGGSIDGWRVIAIGQDSVRLSRGGEVRVLDLPG